MNSGTKRDIRLYCKYEYALSVKVCLSFIRYYTCPTCYNLSVLMKNALIRKNHSMF